MLQDCLNRTEAHLWAVLTNGRRLRLLRDSSSFATAAYVEFDLEAIFDGELFSEFVLLYCVLHASRFEVPEGAAPAGCWLEKWRAEAVTSGARALDQLRLGVQNALTVLGPGSCGIRRTCGCGGRGPEGAAGCVAAARVPVVVRVCG